MEDKNYAEQINELIRKMTGEKTFSADVMEHFLGLKKIADGQKEAMLKMQEKIEKQEETRTEFEKENLELEGLLKKATEKIKNYKKEAKEVRKTKKELKVTLLETKLNAEMAKTNYVQECLRIMFRNPVYQESYSKNVPVKDNNGCVSTHQETGNSDKRVQE